MLRRDFIELLGAAALAPPAVFKRVRASGAPSAVEVPPMLDHILLGSNDLQKGIALIEQRTGVRAAFGGIHPGRGTQNALLSLGPGRYLEIIAPDPEQPESPDPRAKTLRGLPEPKLVGWAAHRPEGLAAYASRLQQANLAVDGPRPGSRKRPDGKTLEWETLALREDSGGLLPFFIQWAPGSVHPSGDAPSGCRLVRFELLSPDAPALSALVGKLSLEVRVSKAARPQLRATILGPAGTLKLAS